MTIEALERLHEEGLLSELDRGFGDLMARLDGRGQAALALAAALASRATGEGHVCVDLQAWAGRTVGGRTGGPVRLPAWPHWRRLLADSGVVGRPGERRPLILEPGGRFYLHRYWDYQDRLARLLLMRAGVGAGQGDPGRLRHALARLFPPGAAGEPNWQQVAAAVAALKSLCIVSGGPGTGKTTTLVRMLALLVEQSLPEVPRIRLVAPTGKAAARMQGALQAALPSLETEAAVRECIPSTASTLHRLLGARPGRIRFRFNGDNPLPVDILVLDEASMVDLALMTRLFEALPAQARVILLGDKDQLASVEAGAVLGDLCAGGAGFSPDFARQLAAVLGHGISPGSAAVSALGNNIVLLNRSYRFSAHSGIGWLARVVKAGADEELAPLLAEGQRNEVRWRELSDPRRLRAALAELSAWRVYWDRVWAPVRDRGEVREVLRASQAFRILVALRRGVFGVEQVNQVVEQSFRARRLISGVEACYRGRPVMVVENDYTLGLYNGDVGVALPDPESQGRLKVFFERADGGLRAISPSRLPRHETVFAMTVHKSQGSEFDQVLFILPPEDTSILSRELIYTGVTRARARLELWGSGDTLRQAVQRPVARYSGLPDRLRGL